MDAQLKNRWVKALRSGDYEQGQGALCKGGKFCCLGVLASLIDPDGFVPTVGPYYNWHHKDYQSGSALPEEFLPTEVQDSLMKLNDGPNDPAYRNDPEYGALNFNQIADYIENEL